MRLYYVENVGSPRSRERWGALDGVLHAIAFAPPEALGGRFLDTTGAGGRGGVPHERLLASSTSPSGLLGLLGRAPGGGAIVGLDFDGTASPGRRMTGSRPWLQSNPARSISC